MLDQSPQNRTDRCLPFLLAGGRGSRLHDLTDRQCKPAINFGSGSGRIVDFILEATVQAGFQQLFVATQYRPYDLCQHLRAQWGHHFPKGISVRDGEQVSPRGYRGTAEAIRLNTTSLDAYAPREIMVLSGDHVADIDLAALLEHHRSHGAAATVAATAVPLADASSFGVFSADAEGRVTAFREKPADPDAIEGDPEHALASTGIYVFDWIWLREMLAAEALRPETQHDFGHDILPRALADGELSVCRITSATPGAEAYWRDVGTLGSYRRTMLDIANSRAALKLPRGMERPLIEAVDCFTEGSVFLPGSSAGQRCNLRNVIVAPGARLPNGFEAGHDATEDRRWFRCGEDGTVLITPEMLARRKAHLAAHTGRPAVRPSMQMPPRGEIGGTKANHVGEVAKA